MKSVKLNALMNTVLTASNMLVSIITVPYVTRVLSVQGYGDVTFAQSVSSWLSTLCLVGVGTYGIRECARVREDHVALVTTVKELLTIISVATALVLSCFAVSIALVPRFAELSVLMWMFLGSTLLLSCGVEWYFQALEQYEYITARSILFKIASLILIILLVRGPQDYLIYGAILALVTCGNNSLNLLRLTKTVDWSIARRTNCRRHIRPLLSFAILSIASSVYLNFDSVILGIVSTNYEVGLYQLAVKIKGIMWTVLNAVLGVMIPRLSNYFCRGNQMEFERLLGKGAVLTVDVCVAFAGYLLVFSQPFAIFVSGEAFRDSSTAIRVIGIVNLLSCLSYFIGLCILTPTGREKKLAAGNIAAVPVSVVMNFILDGKLGAIGAAASVLCAEAVVFAVQLWGARDYASKVFQLDNVLKVIVANGLSALLSVLFLQITSGCSNSAVAVGGTLLYFGSLALILSALQEKGSRELMAVFGAMGSTLFGRFSDKRSAESDDKR